MQLLYSAFFLAPVFASPVSQLMVGPAVNPTRVAVASVGIRPRPATAPLRSTIESTYVTKNVQSPSNLVARPARDVSTRASNQFWNSMVAEALHEKAYNIQKSVGPNQDKKVEFPFVKELDIPLNLHREWLKSIKRSELTPKQQAVFDFSAREFTARVEKIGLKVLTSSSESSPHSNVKIVEHKLDSVAEEHVNGILNLVFTSKGASMLKAMQTASNSEIPEYRIWSQVMFEKILTQLENIK